MHVAASGAERLGRDDLEGTSSEFGTNSLTLTLTQKISNIFDEEFSNG